MVALEVVMFMLIFHRIGLIFPAQNAGGQIDLYVNSMVRTVETNSEGKYRYVY